MTTETRPDGVTLERGFIVDGDRYRYDAALTRAKGWFQYDTEQDAWYFGIWVNPTERKVFTYSEGDTTLETWPDDESFKAGLVAMGEFYGPPPPAFRVMDAASNWTHVYDEDAMFGRTVPGLEANDG